MRRELGLQLVLVRLLRVHAMRLGHHELEVVVLERTELAVARDHARHAGEAQALDERASRRRTWRARPPQPARLAVRALRSVRQLRSCGCQRRP